MPDELPLEPEGAPEATPTEPSVDYEKRWKDTHANWNTLNEQIGRLQKDPEALIEFLQEHHPDLLETEEEPEPELDDEPDTIAPLRSELDQFKAWQAQVETERSAERFARDLKTELGDLKVPEKATDWIKDRTAALGNNQPALKQAVEEFKALTAELGSAHLAEVTKSKRAPHTLAGGQPGTQVPDLDNPQERNRYLRQRAQEVAQANER